MFRKGCTNTFFLSHGSVKPYVSTSVSRIALYYFIFFQLEESTMFRKGCTNTYLRPVSYVFLFITLALTMISFCTSNWYSKTEKGERIFKGVWKVCVGKQDWPGHCYFLPDHVDKHLHPVFDISEGMFRISVFSFYQLNILMESIESGHHLRKKKCTGVF